MQVVSIGCDHAGLSLKTAIIGGLSDIVFLDKGCFVSDNTDYPDVARLVVNDLENCIAVFGVLICGTGIGVSIAANRSLHARAALCYDVETATLARQHNDANIICLGARKTGIADAVLMCREFFGCSFAGGRHSIRVSKLGRLG